MGVVAGMKPLAFVCAIAAVLLLATVGSADAAKHHKRPLCKPRNSHVLKRTSSVRILYVEHPADAYYTTPATVYACFPARHRRVELLDFVDSLAWSPKHMRLTNRYFAVAATTEDVVCEKYQQPDCVTSDVAAFRLSNGEERCRETASASALALTSNGWIAWRSGTTLSACDSAGTRTLDEGNIASVRARGTSVEWTRDGQPQSAVLR
jgi:hypothetical protein